MCLKSAGQVANIVDPDQMPRSAAFNMGLHCLLKPVALLRVNTVIYRWNWNARLLLKYCLRNYI